MDKLPIDIVRIEICKYLNIRDRVRLLTTCKKYYDQEVVRFYIHKFKMHETLYTIKKFYKYHDEVVRLTIIFTMIRVYKQYGSHNPKFISLFRKIDKLYINNTILMRNIGHTIIKPLNL